MEIQLTSLQIWLWSLMVIKELRQNFDRRETFEFAMAQRLTIGENNYIWTTERTNWTAAKEHCYNLGLHLPRIKNLGNFSNAIVRAQHLHNLQAAGAVWLGAYYSKLDNKFRWDDNKELVGEEQLNNDILKVMDEYHGMVINASMQTEAADLSDNNTVMCMGIEKSFFSKGDKYRCNCRMGPCNSSGVCLHAGGRCALDWFGENCQFRDLLQDDGSLLTDFDDHTCESMTESPRTFVIKSKFYLSWIRVVWSTGNLENLKLQVVGPEGRLTDLGSNLVVVKEKTADIWTSMATDTMLSFRLKWDDSSSLCSVYLFGGENVAIHKNASFSSVKSGSNSAKLAVDGERGVLFTYAVADEQDMFQRWTLELAPGNIVVFEIIVYLQSYLSNKMFGVKLTLEFEYVLDDATNTDNVHPFYFEPGSISVSLHSDQRKVVSRLHISLNKTDYTDKNLELSEVEVYGACAPKFFGENCSIPCPNYCLDQLCHYNGECYGQVKQDVKLTTNSTLKTSTSKLLTPKLITSTLTTSTLNLPMQKMSTTEWNETMTFPFMFTETSPELETSPVETSCPAGFAWKRCALLCHCKNNQCDTYGQCLDGSLCADGWFALFCQYRDLAFGAELQYDLLNDNDDSTCLSPKKNLVTAEFSKFFILTWVRLVFVFEAQVQNFTLRFYDEKGRGEQFCKSFRIKSELLNTYDLFCGSLVRTNKITVTWDGTGSLCTLNINGGRNVAPLHHFNVEETSSTPNANNVMVDPLTDGVRATEFCRVFSKDNYNVTFYYQRALVIQTITLITGDEDTFTIHGYFDGSNSSFKYSTLEGGKHEIFCSKTISTVTSSITLLVVAGSMSLCEIEIYGDCAPPNYYMDCSRECHLTCFNNRCNYDGFCYECLGQNFGKFCTDAYIVTSNYTKVNSLEKVIESKPLQQGSSKLQYYHILIPWIIAVAAISYLISRKGKKNQNSSESYLQNQNGDYVRNRFDTSLKEYSVVLEQQSFSSLIRERPTLSFGDKPTLLIGDDSEHEVDPPRVSTVQSKSNASLGDRKESCETNSPSSESLENMYLT